MYAVLEIGGKQYKVEKDSLLRVELLPYQEGEEVSFDKVLLLSDGEHVKCGAPYLDTACVKAEVMRHGKGRKLLVMRFKKRKNYRRLRGHRQSYTELRIREISVGG